jgi:peptidoglycan-associated lipoprotein
LKGFEPAPLGNLSGEERVSEGVVVAKAEPSEAARQQAEEIRKEQAATTVAGLKDVFFGFDSWKITEEGRQSLSSDAQWLKEHQDKQVTIEGHCDQRGTQAYNLVLGEKRAKAVRTYLTELGVAVSRLSIASLGKERPFCREHTDACYQQNRRAHVVLRGQ